MILKQDSVSTIGVTEKLIQILIVQDKTALKLCVRVPVCY